MSNKTLFLPYFQFFGGEKKHTLLTDRHTEEGESYMSYKKRKLNMNDNFKVYPKFHFIKWFIENSFTPI